ncbi:rab-GTPase-TBC domain-containing protein [Bombardia bombarda]|uniref:Rab-GTPase-TBC domain-containing protein n=1 Tax=Bombardia bombarda TaxID=252184 RepID=A0AA40CGC2_9PEZI|nr:rab-GTPase-TBC domain-containing protein [Bombardia bombarda]
MELDQEETSIHHGQKPPSTKSASISSDGTHGRSNSSPVATEFDKSVMGHDSLVTVRLSEPPSLHINTTVSSNPLPSRKSLYGIGHTPSSAVAETAKEEEDSNSEGSSEVVTPVSERGQSLQEELEQTRDDDTAMEIEEVNAQADARFSSGSEVVNWDQLQEKEDEESKDQDSDNSTALLLARLEQENDKIATNPKSIKVKVVEMRQDMSERRPRPPSMAQLRKMVHGPTPSALRYSILPPPPMTELEFYMALVKDPQQTAARLPTLLSNKVRKGIPPPLRGVVWQSMSGARDSALEEMFERLSGESSPYEGIIGKDLGRSFPGVDMFRDPDGDGQRMLGRVLKCFSLYDTKIGYCQGLAFLVGPLLMHMPDKQAFCVLVRLMENYDLRHCFVPDLSGLHVRIYQFRELLRLHLPTLSAHLDDLQVEPAYVSQWFLSFFAVTCPLPMLFRIYDVIFAEGASETIMRVAMSLMRKNQARILGCTEMEDVMQLLLSRGLWDCYHYNADEFVQDFVNLSDVVTRERMAALEQGYREAKINTGANPKSTDAAQQASDVTTAASRFLGRLWASSSTPKLASFAAAAAGGASSSSTTTSTSTASNSLSPGLIAAATRPLSMLRRSTSKQSIASTLNSMEAASSTTSSSAASVLSSASTEATSVSRDSASNDSSRESAPGFGASNSRTAPTSFSGSASTARDGSKYLHSQIEDLLTALSELQRNYALLNSQLEKEKEDRDEDRIAVRSLVAVLRNKASTETVTPLHRGDSEDTITSIHVDASSDATNGQQQHPSTDEQLSSVLDIVEARFSEAAASRRSSVLQTRSQLRDELVRAKEQLSNEMAKTQDCKRTIYEMEQEVANMKDQLRESHAHVRSLHQDKQRLERQMHGMRVRASDTPASSSAESGGSNWFSNSSSSTAGSSRGVVPSAGGLRELKLSRSKSTPSQAPQSFNNSRASSFMMTHHNNGSRESFVPVQSQTSESGGPVSEHDAILLELVQAKTAEAVARQEAEEAKQKLENMRKAFGLAPGETPGGGNNGGGGGASSAASTAMGMFGRLTGSGPTPASDVGGSTSAGGTTVASAGGNGAGNGNGAAATTAASTTASTGSGFWGWRR